MGILIRQSQILRPDGQFQLGDVLLQQDKITAIAPQIDSVNLEITQIINAEGLTLLPGVIDPQVHFRFVQ